MRSKTFKKVGKNKQYNNNINTGEKNMITDIITI